MLLPSPLQPKLQRLASRSLSIFAQSTTRKLYRSEQAMRGTLPRHLYTTPRILSSGSLFNLSGLSTSREAGFLSKERGIPRTEFAPHLELIRLSEVEPFAEKKLPANSLQPSPASSHKLTQLSDDSGISVAYLVKELESTKLAKEEAQNLNRELQRRTRAVEERLEGIRERLTALSIFAAIGSIFGLYYRRELYDVILQFSPNAQGLQMASNPPSELADVERTMEIPAMPPENTSPPTPDQNVDRASSWRRMFWAS